MKLPLLMLCLLTAGPSSAQAPSEAAQAELREDLQRLDAQAQRLEPQARLTSQQLFELLRLREQRRGPHMAEDPGPYIVSTFFFLCLLLGFLGWQLAVHRRAYHLQQTVRLMVEKGAEIPSALLAPPERKPSDLRRGIILSTTGLGLTFFLAALPDAPGAWGAGLTLFLIGLGHRGGARFSSWLLRIACNLYFSQDRASRHAPVSLAEPDELPSPVALPERFLERHDLERALATLKPRERAALVLTYANELTHEEAALVLDCPLGTLKTQVARAREKLRRHFEDTP